MKVLVVGGTRYFGIPMVERLLEEGHDVTLATRGITKDCFENKVKRIQIDITNDRFCKPLRGMTFDTVIDKIGYSSNEMKRLLDNVKCRQFIHMSTAGVYNTDHYDIKESEFNPKEGDIIWCERKDLSYHEVKQNAERVLEQLYPQIKTVSVRYPIVLGLNDYTGRLKYYVDSILHERPIHISDMHTNLCFAECCECGEFLAYLVGKEVQGAINGCAKGNVLMGDLIKMIEDETNKKAIIDGEEDLSPFDNEKSYSLNLEKAENVGFIFSNLESWLSKLIHSIAISI